ncbi:metalloregulator ArsR/SmtB family transcription factor [uncultured Desulfovibrio sp.]|uniref:ArsR/SmtB family transcription factor n=1 Tax=uncultured Desulfovibrio sp. TaxID=167968 RepID=UPI00261F9198|nr:metalloregulator ArsR/SmtB family transcription factor [uncultured Desulfovibrio sp.]
MNIHYITALPDDWERVAQVFSAMGDATRQKILLLFEPGERISLSALVHAVGMSRTAVSHHVTVLVRAGLLRPQRSGKEVFYRRDLPFTLEMLDRVRDYAVAELAAEERDAAPTGEDATEQA